MAEGFAQIAVRLPVSAALPECEGQPDLLHSFHRAAQALAQEPIILGLDYLAMTLSSSRIIPINHLDRDLQARIKDTNLTSLEGFRSLLREVQQIQEHRWFQGHKGA